MASDASSGLSAAEAPLEEELPPLEEELPSWLEQAVGRLAGTLLGERNLEPEPDGQPAHAQSHGDASRGAASGAAAATPPLCSPSAASAKETPAKGTPAAKANPRQHRARGRRSRGGGRQGLRWKPGQLFWVPCALALAAAVGATTAWLLMQSMVDSWSPLPTDAAGRWAWGARESEQSQSEGWLARGGDVVRQVVGHAGGLVAYDSVCGDTGAVGAMATQMASALHSATARGDSAVISGARCSASLAHVQKKLEGAEVQAQKKGAPERERKAN